MVPKELRFSPMATVGLGQGLAAWMAIGFSLPGEMEHPAEAAVSRLAGPRRHLPREPDSRGECLWL